MHRRAAARKPGLHRLRSLTLVHSLYRTCIFESSLQLRSCTALCNGDWMHAGCHAENANRNPFARKRPQSYACLHAIADTLFLQVIGDLKVFLGIDVGTGGTRAVLVDRGGPCHRLRTQPTTRPSTPQHIGWAEQDPEDWWRAAQRGHRAALMAAAELASRRDRSRRPHRPDAWLRHARRRRRSPPPRAHLVRSAHPARVRLARSRPSAASASSS